MTLSRRHTLGGIATFWLIPSEGARLDDIIGKEISRIISQAIITLQVRKDSVEVASSQEGDQAKQTLVAFHSGASREAADYLRRISGRLYYIVARDRDGKMILLNTSPTEFRYEQKQDEGTGGEKGFVINVETEADNSLVRVLTLSLKNMISDSNLALLKDSGDKLIRS